MAFWCRIKKTKLISLSNQLKRCYFRIPGPFLVDHTASNPRVGVILKPATVIPNTSIEFPNNVRFFAAPVQKAKPKQEEKDSSGPRLNEQITAHEVRLVTEEGHSILSRREALERARCLKLDLVEVQRNATPPVCKLADYHEEKYKKQIKEKDRAKSKSEVTLRKGAFKEVRFSGKTEQKDLQMKADTVKRLMERGYRVKCMAMGTEDQDLGGLLSRLSALIEDVSVVESGPWVEKKQAYAIVRHVKFGPLKKGPGKKVSKVVGATSPVVQNGVVNPAVLNQSPIQSEEFFDPESGLGTDGEEADTPTSPSLENLDIKNPTWSAFEANDDFDSVFDLGIDAKGGKYSGDVQSEPAPQTASSAANSFSDFGPRPVVDSIQRERVLPSPLEPRNNDPPGKSMDGNGTSYGIFSAPEFNNPPARNGLPAEPNRYKKVNTFDSTRNPRPRGVSANPNTPSSDADRGGRPVGNTGGQGKWGVFSTESSNVILSRNSESQAKVPR